MPDWRLWIRERLAGLDLPAVDEIDVVEELAQHVEDRFQDLAASGVSEPDAMAQSLREIDDPALVAELLAAVRRN